MSEAPVDIPKSLLNSAPPASSAMVYAALEVPMWNHISFVEGWSCTRESEIAIIFGQMFSAMELARSS